MILLITGNGASTKIDLRSVQAFQTQTLCQDAATKTKQTVLHTLSQAHAQQIRFDLACCRPNEARSGGLDFAMLGLPCSNTIVCYPQSTINRLPFFKTATSTILHGRGSVPPRPGIAFIMLKQVFEWIHCGLTY
jgi:hypothetical protein